jgi:hypothetical protein
MSQGDFAEFAGVLGFLVIGAAFILVPVDIWGAAAIGRYIYKKLKEPAP